MCMLTFDYPQTYAVAGSAEEQLAQLRSYIWQLVDVLNQADDGNEAGIGAADTAAIRTELEKLRKALRDLEAKSGHGLPSGGTAGQTLTKLSDSDYDTGWREPTGGTGVVVDDALDAASTNPVQNKAIAAALAQKLGKADVADYITEQGLTGKWMWRKWASGIAEMWATFDTDKLEMTSQTWGALYTASWMGLAANKKAREYPFAFIENPVVSATPTVTSGNIWLATNTENNLGTRLTHAPAYQCVRASDATVNNPQISYYVVGRYK